MVYIKVRFSESVYPVFGIILILSLWILSGCTDDNSTGPDTLQVAKISISPEEATLEKEEQIDFSVFALTTSGDTINTDDIDIEWQWWSTNPDVFTVEPGGLATGQNTGEAFCVVEATVSVSLNNVDKLVIQYAGFGLNRTEKESTETKRLNLLPDNPDLLEVDRATLKKSRLRFTGRDSAIVFVF